MKFLARKVLKIAVPLFGDTQDHFPVVQDCLNICKFPSCTQS